MTLPPAPGPEGAAPACRPRTVPDPGRRRLGSALLAVPLARLAPAVAVLAPAAAAANEGIDVQRAALELTADGEAWMLAADFAVPLSPRVDEAVSRGVPLYFAVDFVLLRPRWYWFDERAVDITRTWRLAYHALTREYRLSTGGGLPQRFYTLAEAMAALSRVRGWRVVDAARVRGGTFEASVRMRLDLSQLPKPFQVGALTDRDWNLQSEWKRFLFNPEIPKSVQ